MAELLDTGSGLAGLLALPAFKGPVCLDFIDPYGNTIFNQHQLPHLVSELEAVRGNLTDRAVRAAAEHALQAARDAQWADSIIRGYEEAVEHASASPLLEHLDALVALARKAIATGPHIYLKFYGD
jgi:hypothetical protein